MATRRTVLAGFGGAAVGVTWSGGGLLARAQDATPGATPAATNPDLGGSIVTISHYRLKDGADPAALVAAVRDSLLPIVTAIPGFWEYRLVISADRTATSIRVYDTEAATDEANAKVREWAGATIADLSELPAFMVVSGALEADADAY